MPWILCEVCKEEEFRTAKTPCSYCAGTAQPLNGEDINYVGEVMEPGVPSKKRVARSSAPATLDDVVASQNRTTHAIRALVRFLFIQFSTLFVAGFFSGLALVFDENFLNIIALLVVLGGLIASSVAGWNELQKSDVPY